MSMSEGDDTYFLHILNTYCKIFTFTKFIFIVCLSTYQFADIYNQHICLYHEMNDIKHRQVKVIGRSRFVCPFIVTRLVQSNSVLENNKTQLN